MLLVDLDLVIDEILEIPEIELIISCVMDVDVDVDVDISNIVRNKKQAIDKMKNEVLYYTNK